MKLAANLSLMWPELPFADRFDAAAAAGFEGVEILFPYDVNVQDIQSALRRTGLQMVLMNAPPPNYTGGDRGFAAKPGGEDRFKYDMRRVFRYADVLGVRFVHIMAGEGTGADAFSTFVSNLIWAARQAPEALTLTIEPLNPTDVPGYFLDDYGLAARVLEAVAEPNVKLQFDSYHAQMIHGDAVKVWQDYHSQVAHVQVADAPRRMAPGQGEVNFSDLITEVHKSGYAGWISAEYKPIETQTSYGLDWMDKFRKAVA